MKSGMKGITIQVPIEYAIGGATAKKIIDAFFQFCDDHKNETFQELKRQYPKIQLVKEALNW